MKNLCIVPFTQQSFFLLNALKDQSDSISLVAPTGIGSSDQDVSILRNTDPVGHCFNNSVEEGVSSSDIVIIPYVSENDKSLYAFTKNALHVAANAGKEIKCFTNLPSNEKSLLHTICGRNGGNICFFNDLEKVFAEKYNSLQLYSFDVPVLFVAETIPDCDGYDVFLSLALRLQRDGKRVLAISEDVYNVLFGFHAICFDVGVPLHAQVAQINRIIYQFAHEEHPDIILIRLPYPMMKYDDRSPFDGGASAFVISQAVPADGCILCSHAGISFDRSFWDELTNSVHTKFGVPIVAVHTSNRMLDRTSDESMASLRIPVTEVELSHKGISNECIPPLYNLLHFADMQIFIERISSDFLNLPYGVI